VARGAALAGLSAATRARLRRGADLRAAAGDGWLVVLGAPDALPWADGCVYVGREGELLVPTTRAVDPGPDLVAAALRREGASLLVVLEDAVLRGPLPARAADPDALP
jgi:hypothetical protein